MTEPVTIERLIEAKIWIEIQPVDDWYSWTYRIYIDDSMSPFFEAHASNDGIEYSSYELAFEAAKQWLIENDLLGIVTRVF